MKRLRIKIQNKCRKCGAVWMDRQQLTYCQRCLQTARTIGVTLPVGDYDGKD